MSLFLIQPAILTLRKHTIQYLNQRPRGTILNWRIRWTLEFTMRISPPAKNRISSTLRRSGFEVGAMLV